MSMNQTPSGERVHIGIFGKRNAGKSSLINALTGQELAIVSETEGTTTDPVLKAMELLPLGPVVMIDTPGLDDTGELGALRIRKAFQMLNKTDLALLVLDGNLGVTGEDIRILERIREKNIPCIAVINKADTLTSEGSGETAAGRLQEVTSALLRCGLEKDHILPVSAKQGTNIRQLKDLLASLAPKEDANRRIVGDLIRPSDLVILVVPIDKAAPKGRLILPQQQTIRDILDADACAVVVKENRLKETFARLSEKPALVITDSQVFERVAADTPRDVPLTSFSILFARYKGNLETLAKGARAIDRLKDGNTVLISEGCTHHRQCGDIGTEKLPRWLETYTGRKLSYRFTSGTEFPADLSRYDLILHCGGCMLNEREMKYRLKCAADAGVPMTNYGTAIAWMHGILERSLEIFPQSDLFTR